MAIRHYYGDTGIDLRTWTVHGEIKRKKDGKVYGFYFDYYVGSKQFAQDLAIKELADAHANGSVDELKKLFHISYDD